MITTLSIDGMRSVHCARAVYTALAGVAGIERAEVSIGRAIVEHAGALDEAGVAEAVKGVGYVLRAVVTERRRLPVHLAVQLPGDPPIDQAPAEGVPPSAAPADTPTGRKDT